MNTASFFGHRNYDYTPYKEKLRAVIVDLIENHGVKIFYNGYRGNFDRLCAELVHDLKKSYPDIINIMVLSYLDLKDFNLPKYFDESIYLLERRVPPQYAILCTNQEIVLRSDYIISGICYHLGGAYAAYEFARQKKKVILGILEDTWGK